MWYFCNANSVWTFNLKYFRCCKRDVYKICVIDTKVTKKKKMNNLNKNTLVETIKKLLEQKENQPFLTLFVRRTFCFAQTRTHQLLVHNKELLDHIASLVSLLHDQERIRTELQHHSLPPVSAVHFFIIWFFVVFVRSHLPLGHATNLLSYFFNFFFFFVFFIDAFWKIFVAVRLGIIISGATKIFSRAVSA